IGGEFRALAVLTLAFSALFSTCLGVIKQNHYITSFKPSFIITSRSLRSSIGLMPGVLVPWLEAWPGGGARAAACA
ncbi:hypothetical protein BJX62DRAFT_221443, partial [Aspergillus germanicus]